MKAPSSRIIPVSSSHYDNIIVRRASLRSESSSAVNRPSNRFADPLHRSSFIFHHYYFKSSQFPPIAYLGRSVSTIRPPENRSHEAVFPLFPLSPYLSFILLHFSPFLFLHFTPLYPPNRSAKSGRPAERFRVKHFAGPSRVCVYISRQTDGAPTSTSSVRETALSGELRSPAIEHVRESAQRQNEASKHVSH